MSNSSYKNRVNHDDGDGGNLDREPPSGSVWSAGVDRSLDCDGAVPTPRRVRFGSPARLRASYEEQEMRTRTCVGVVGHFLEETEARREGSQRSLCSHQFDEIWRLKQGAKHVTHFTP